MGRLGLRGVVVVVVVVVEVMVVVVVAVVVCVWCVADLRNVLESTTQSESADPLGIYNTCLRQVLDHHASLVTRTVTDRTSTPWMTLEVKQAKVERRTAERKWRQSGLTVHREIYAKQRNLV